MGYPTPAHRAGLNRLGITPLHRRGYKLVQTQLELLQLLNKNRL
jgi:ribonuclease HII